MLENGRYQRRQAVVVSGTWVIHITGSHCLTVGRLKLPTEFVGQRIVPTEWELVDDFHSGKRGVGRVAEFQRDVIKSV